MVGQPADMKPLQAAPALPAQGAVDELGGTPLRGAARIGVGLMGVAIRIRHAMKPSSKQGWGAFRSTRPGGKRGTLRGERSVRIAGGQGDHVELLVLAVAAVVLPYLAGRRPRKRRGDGIKGWAKVTDGDGNKVKGYTVRLADLDAPEWNQPAKHRFGFWFNHGKRVKRALSRAGRPPRPSEGRGLRPLRPGAGDGELPGNGRRGNGWCDPAMRSPASTAATGRRSESRGMWGYGQAIDPGVWRRRQVSASSWTRRQGRQRTFPRLPAGNATMLRRRRRLAAHCRPGSALGAPRTRRQGRSGFHARRPLEQGRPRRQRPP